MVVYTSRLPDSAQEAIRCVRDKWSSSHHQLKPSFDVVIQEEPDCPWRPTGNRSMCDFGSLYLHSEWQMQYVP